MLNNDNLLLDEITNSIQTNNFLKFEKQINAYKDWDQLYIKEEGQYLIHFIICNTKCLLYIK